MDALRDKVINLEDKMDAFQNTTEASTRENHHEVVELLQDTSSSLDGKIHSLIWHGILSSIPVSDPGNLHVAFPGTNSVPGTFAWTIPWTKTFAGANGWVIVSANALVPSTQILP